MNVDGLLSLRLEVQNEIDTLCADRKKEHELQIAKYKRLQKEKHNLEDQLLSLSQRINKEDSEAKQGKYDLQESLYKHWHDLIRPISLCSLKHSMPKTFERYIGYGSEEDSIIKQDMIFENPLISIIAFFRDDEKSNSYSRRRVNKITYTLQVLVHKRSLSDLKWFDERFDDSIRYNLLRFQAFKTIEEAEKYHARNKEKLIKDILPIITGFLDEIQNAPDGFKDVFDFRLLRKDHLKYSYSGSQDFPIEHIEKDMLKLKGGITVTIGDDYNFVIVGANDQKPKDNQRVPYSDKEQIRLALEEEFHLFSRQYNCIEVR